MTNTTLTREALLNRAKPRYEVVDVPGFGNVGIRSQSEVKRARRTSRMFDDKGQYVDEAGDMQRTHKLIDQLMIDESTPMFTEADVETISASNSETFDALMFAINTFNAKHDDPKKKGESSGTNENSKGTTA